MSAFDVVQKRLPALSAAQDRYIAESLQAVNLMEEEVIRIAQSQVLI